ncbi:MAG: hypothetical protein ABIH42_03365 [Planctomycetota bacterium]
MKTQSWKLSKLFLTCETFFLLTLLTGCATNAMRNGVAQACYEIQRAKTEQFPLLRLERAESVLRIWRQTYGEESRAINDESFTPVCDDMEEESSLSSVINPLSHAADGGWASLLFGAGGATTFLLALLKLLRERRKRKSYEYAVSDCVTAIETISDEDSRNEAKETVRKKQSSRTDLHALIQNIPGNHSA